FSPKTQTTQPPPLRHPIRTGNSTFTDRRSSAIARALVSRSPSDTTRLLAALANLSRVPRPGSHSAHKWHPYFGHTRHRAELDRDPHAAGRSAAHICALPAGTAPPSTAHYASLHTVVNIIVGHHMRAHSGCHVARYFLLHRLCSYGSHLP